MSENLGSAIFSVSTDNSKFNRGLDDAHSKAKSITGSIKGVFDGLGKLGLAAMGVQVLAQSVKGLGDALGLGLNAEMENTRAQLVAFVKDGALAEKILAGIRKEANQTPFAFQDMADATIGLIPAAKMANIPYMELVKTAEILAATNPMEGLKGAAFSLREAMSGDFTSIIERFNLPRTAINKLKDEGLPALEVVRRAMQQMGYDEELIANMAGTATGKWSTLMDAFDTFRSTISAPLFDRLKGLEDRILAFVSTDDFQGWANSIAGAVDAVLDGLGSLAGAFGETFGEIFSVVSYIGQAIYEAMSWLNPFATHSPSLVSQVEDGTAEISQAYSTTARTVTSSLNSASSSVNGFNQNVVKSGTVANASKSSLDSYKKVVEGIKDQLDSARRAIQDFTSAPLAGSGAMDDAVFAKQQEINQIELAMLKFQHSGLGQDAMQPKYEEMKQYKQALEEQKRILELEKTVQFEPLERARKALTAPAEIGFADAMKGIADNLKIVADLQPKYDDMSETMKGMQAAAGGVGSAMTTASGDIKSSIGNIAEEVDKFKANFEEAKTSTKTFIEGIYSPFKTAKTTLAAWIENLKQAISSGINLDELGGNIEGQINNTWQRLIDFIKFNGPILGSTIETEWVPRFNQWLEKARTEVWPRLADLLNRYLDFIRDNGPVIAEKFISEWLPAAIGWLAKIGTAMKPEQDKLVEDIKTWIIKEGAPKIAEISIEMGKAMITGILKGLDGLARELAGAMARALQDALVSIGGGGSTPELSTPPQSLPAYAFGTPYVPYTGLALVHEGERIIPASQNRGGDTNISIGNIYAPGGPTQVREAVKLGVMDALALSRARGN